MRRWWQQISSPTEQSFPRYLKKSQLRKIKWKTIARYNASPHPVHVTRHTSPTGRPYGGLRWVTCWERACVINTIKIFLCYMYIVLNCHFVLFISSHTIQTHSHLSLTLCRVRDRRTGTVIFSIVCVFLKKLVVFRVLSGGWCIRFLISNGGVFVITRARCYCWRFDGRRGTVSSLKPWPPRTRTLLARDWLKTLPPLARDTKLSSVSPSTESTLVFALGRPAAAESSIPARPDDTSGAPFSHTERGRPNGSAEESTQLSEERVIRCIVTSVHPSHFLHTIKPLSSCVILAHFLRGMRAEHNISFG